MPNLQLAPRAPKQPPDTETLEMIRRHDRLWRELECIEGDDPRWHAMSHEVETLAVEIVTAKVATAEALAGKRRVIDRELFGDDEIVRLILIADEERVASAV